jgi:translocation and assembly module TamA
MKRSTLKANYWIPVFDPVTDRIGIGSKIEKEETEDTDRITVDLDGGWYFDRNGWDSRIFSEFKMEKFRTDGDSWNKTKLLSMGASTQYASFPNDIFPRTGWRIKTGIRGAAGIISDISYTRVNMQGTIYYPLLNRGRINARCNLGFAWTSDFDQYPASLRFFAGGDESIRGYKWKELGPEDNDGKVEGGKNIMTGSIEYDYRILDKWVTALFVDAGNAFNSFPDKFYIGAGTGIRWLSPVGTVRLDFAWPMNDKDDDPKLSSIHFYFGFEINM